MKLLTITLLLIFNTAINAAVESGGVGSSNPVEGEIISVTYINENLDNVCYLASDNKTVCVVVEK